MVPHPNVNIPPSPSPSPPPTVDEDLEILAGSKHSPIKKKCRGFETPGKQTLLFDGYYYDVTSFVDRHPGGDLIRMYLNNDEDATLAIQQFHLRSSRKVQGILNSFPKRKATEEDLLRRQATTANLSRDQSLTKDFNTLFRELESEGLFEPCMGHVLMRYFELLVLTTLGNLFLYNGWWVLGAAFMAWGCGRSGWFVHEAGHHSLTGKPNLDRWIQSHVYGIYCGVSAGCWRNHHSKHHAMPQHVKNDVDLDTLPIMAFHTSTVKDPKKQFNLLIRYQKWMIYVVQSTILGFYWKYFEDPLYALKHGEWWDLFHMALHQVYIIHLGLPTYILVSVLATSYLVLNSTLSHSHLDVAGHDESAPTHWVEYGLVHTANVRSSWWVDYFMGYLNYQIEHHLFPTMPQFRNKLASKRVKALAQKYDLPYHLFSYWDILTKTVQNLGNVSDEISKSIKSKID